MQIVISGTVGIGKSTVSELLVKKLKLTKKNVFLYEEIKNDVNPYLEFYYKTRVEWSFLIQLDFLFKRFKELFLESQKTEIKKIVVFDRHFLDDYIFTNMKPIKDDMSSFQLETYFQINNFLSNKLIIKNKPDYFILLKSDFDTVIERLSIRGREEEKTVDLNYWKEMFKTYYEDEIVKKYLIDNTKNFIVLNTTNKTVEEITKEILDLIIF